MGLLQRLKQMVAGPEPGVVLECASCGERTDEARAECPNCGSEELVEKEGFRTRPE
ncbi:hypothetical protein [Halococcus agarilyticus]|uniref:hypothetical protein n=1 Tax=Halococcus agarilyticus TaxID=1232219 RepID=UPI000AB231FB|nr:hypothetical protein [Halococcus agarilyticus]